MKYIFLLVVAIMSLTACNSSNSDENGSSVAGTDSISGKLLGEWQMDHINLDMTDTLTMNEEDRLKARNELDTVLAEFNSHKHKMQIIFEEGRYAYLQPSDTIIGEWELLPNTTMVEFKINGFENLPQYENIIYVDDKELHMYDSNAVGILYFKRIK